MSDTASQVANAFSNKVKNQEAVIASHFVYYNFCRVHKTFRVTPAMEAGLAHHVRTVEELLMLLPVEELKTRGTYKPRK